MVIISVNAKYKCWYSCIWKAEMHKKKKWKQKSYIQAIICRIRLSQSHQWSLEYTGNEFKCKINLKETFSEPTEKLSLIRLVKNSSSLFSAGAPIFCLPACITVLKKWLPVAFNHSYPNQIIYVNFFLDIWFTTLVFTRNQEKPRPKR